MSQGPGLDHLVVAARTLADGVAWCEATLGLTPAPGGRHSLMGTHNRLVKLEGEAFPASYLEIIAIDPEAPVPPHPRWFGLDTRDLSGGPRLVHAVVRSADLEASCAALRGLGLDPGVPVAASRETPSGRLAWRLVLRPDGTLLCDGALPTLIAWDRDSGHPAATLPPQGLRLAALTLAGVPPAARTALALPGIAWADAAPGRPALQAVLQAPAGRVVLTSEVSG